MLITRNIKMWLSITSTASTFELQGSTGRLLGDFAAGTLIVFCVVSGETLEMFIDSFVPLKVSYTCYFNVFTIEALNHQDIIALQR